MTHFSELKDRVNTKTLHLVLLTLATAGIYPLMWLYRNIPTMESVTQQKIASNTLLTWLGVCIGLSGGLSGSGDEILDAIAGLFVIGGFVLYIVIAFKMKAGIETYAANTLQAPIKLNPILTLGGTLYYINYRMNKLAETSQTEAVSQPAQ